MLQPSTLDALPLVTLEALACGTPVIAYETSAIKQNFKDCEAVLRAPIKDTDGFAGLCLQLLADASYRQTLSSKAIAFASNYTWENVLQSEKHGYQKVIALKNHGKT